MVIERQGHTCDIVGENNVTPVRVQMVCGVESQVFWSVVDHSARTAFMRRGRDQPCTS